MPPMGQLPADLGNFPEPPPHMRGWEWRESEANIDEGESQWTPRIWPGDNTPLHLMLASPTRQGILHAAPAAAAVGAGLYAADADPAVIAGGAATAATLAGLYGYLARRRKNEDIQADMRRLPPGATRGDAEAILMRKSAVDIAQAEAAAAAIAQQDAMARIRNAAIAGLALGAGTAGARGLYDLVRRNATAPKPDRQRVTLPVPATPAPPEEEVQGVKAAEDSWFGRMWSGEKATRPDDIPGNTAATILAGLGAGAVGFKGVDLLLEAQRRREREKELAKARSGFHEALLSQYAAKQATLDELYGRFEALAVSGAGFTPPEAPEGEKRALGEALAGNITDKYLAYAALASLLAGATGYAHANNTSNRLALEHAKAESARRKASTNPSPMYAVPMPVPRRIDHDKATAELEGVPA